jgi:hypothetical protein
MAVLISLIKMSVLAALALLACCSAFNSTDFAGGSLDGFFSYSDIKTWTSLAASRNSSIVYAGSIGTSSDGLEIPYVRLSSSDNKLSKVDVLISAGTSTAPLHASLVVYFFNDILQAEGLEYLLATRNFWFVPVINADSYSLMGTTFNSSSNYTFFTKNRQSSDCNSTAQQGINLDRNFPYEWNLTTSDGCRDEYAGPSAQSAAEVKSILTFISKLSLKAWIHFDGREAVYRVPYSFSSSSNYSSSDLQEFYEFELLDGVPNDFKYGTYSDLTGYTATGTLVDYAASIGALALQIGFSTKFPTKAQIAYEADLHSLSVHYLSIVGSSEY